MTGQPVWKSTKSGVLLMILKMQNFEKAATRRSEKRSPEEQRVSANLTPIIILFCVFFPAVKFSKTSCRRWLLERLMVW